MSGVARPVVVVLDRARLARVACACVHLARVRCAHDACVRACARLRCAFVCVRVISEDGAMVPANPVLTYPPPAVLERMFGMKGPDMT